MFMGAGGISSYGMRYTFLWDEEVNMFMGGDGIHVLVSTHPRIELQSYDFLY